MRVLFLDIDGVLNRHKQYKNGYCGMELEKLDLLDWIVIQTKCQIVLASAWRYMVLAGSMNLQGFRNLMSTHGAGQATVESMRDHLPEDSDSNDRGAACLKWTIQQQGVESFLAIDDLDLGYSQRGIPLIQTKSDLGLTASQAAQAIQLLRNQT